MTSLDIPLSTSYLDDLVKESIQNALRGPARGSSFRPIALTAYWYYLQKKYSQSLHARDDGISAKSYGDLIQITNLVKQRLGRDEVLQKLQEATVDSMFNKSAAEGSLNLAASLLSMIDFGTLENAFSGRTQLQWRKGPLQKTVRDYFEEPPALSAVKVKLEKTFNAESIRRIAGIEIVWTDNLADHLRLTNDDTRIHIFHHVSFLRWQDENDIFPAGLVEETLRTLALLLPSDRASIRKWYGKLAEPSTLDSYATQCGALKSDDRHIERFQFWHDRLVTLKQAYDEAQPRTLSQWWHDRRNGVQWYTFWVAVVVLLLTLFFGAIQCVEGALQVYFSWLAMNQPAAPASRTP